METIAIYGKGGIGKSVVATHLSAELARRGLRVLHVGCDPKADSSCRLVGSYHVKTVLDAMRRDPEDIVETEIVTRGRGGIDCIEAGGPEPGAGCGGRGVARAIEIIGELDLLGRGSHDVAVFDVLGDVVCGGFAAPMRRGFAKKVYIVVSEESMALFAANNIARAVLTNAANGVVLAGLVANLRGADEVARTRVHAFAARIGTSVVMTLERSTLIAEAELALETAVERSPGSEVASLFRTLAEHCLGADTAHVPLPNPLEQEAFFEFMREP
jgi:nitrogenase iron protein NifH